MEQRQRPVLAPQYAYQFSCIGPECEDTCCHGWRVFVDEATYKRYRRLRHPELSPLLDKAVTRNRSNPTPRNYAKINLNDQGVCPLLSAEGLCRVHEALGADYLCTTCAVYPRVTHVVDGELERSLTMSCPEAARIALLNPEPMEFDRTLEPVDARNAAMSQIDTGDRNAARKLDRHFWDVRAFIIGFLQNRAYRLWERLVLLGLFMQKLDQLKEVGYESVPDLVERYRAAFEDGSLRDSLRNIPAQATIQVKLARELVGERFRLKISQRGYVECLVQALAGLRATRDATDEAIGQCYQDAYASYYSPFMDEREYILENYVVNHVFKNLFPLGSRGPFGEYVMLVIHYALIKMHLIGMAAHHQGLTEELVIKLVYSFSRTSEHNETYLRRIYEMLVRAELATMPYMAILIKN